MSDRPSVAVVETVAEAEGMGPLDLEVPLYEAVEPEAMDKMFSRSNSDIQLGFRYYGYRVLVEQDDGISVSLEDKE